MHPGADFGGKIIQFRDREESEGRRREIDLAALAPVSP
jgi:hypothetical protein